MEKNTLTNGFYLWRGFTLLTHPKLRPYVIIPLIINIAIFAALLLFSIHSFNYLVNWIDHFLPSWLRWLNWLLWTLFAIASFLAAAYTFSIIANLVGAPFNSFLSEKAEELFAPEHKANIKINLLKEIPRVLTHEGQKILYYLPRALLLLILFFIPGINIIAPFIWFLFNSWMMSIQYLDYPMDNHHLDFPTIRTKLQKKRAPSLIFGASIMLATMIPIINLIVMPAAVIGATMFWIEQEYGIKS